jgi:hypothetical protein
MNFYYKKNKNKDLFKDLENANNGNYLELQNYIPLYSKFFSLNETNWNSINLNNSKFLVSIVERKNDNNYIVKLNNGYTEKCYFKLAPLIDPIKFMIGKYNDFSYNSLKITEILPKYNKSILEKIDTHYNFAYTDSFFTYLSSKLKNKYDNPHCIDFYGSYLGLKQYYKFNIYDDLEYLYESEHFLENINTLFKINGDLEKDLINFNTRKNKEKLQFNKTFNDKLSICSENNEEYEKVFQKCDNNNNEIVNLSDIDNLNEYIIEINNKTSVKTKNTKTSKTTCSSRTSITQSSNTNSDTDSDTDSDSHTTTSENQSINENDNGDDNEHDNDTHGYNSCSSESIDNNSETNSLSSTDSEFLEAEIQKFPVQIIAMEKLTHTLDKYMEENNISSDEWLSIFMQIFMNLLTYKKAFKFTHNDLHTNNIMYIETDKLYFYYKFNNKYYKVPTYGKIYKIIDFGRAIYTFKNEFILNDSYSDDGDAATQFNCGQYLNKNKPYIEPNYSFDLCRLACSLYDNFINDDDNDKQDKNNEDMEIITNLIKEWCTDDNGKNILYKSNGKERYPGFKLYKMITRTVHKHTPEEQFKKNIFKKFEIKIRNINTIELINIDAITKEF